MNRPNPGRDTIRLLVLEDDPDLAFIVREELDLHSPNAFEFTHAYTLSEALSLLSGGTFDVALVDLTLPDSHGAETVAAIRTAAPQLAVVVLTNIRDEEIGLKIVELGVQDFLVKGNENGSQLSRALRHAIQRKRMECRLEQLAQYDQLTGLPNRSLFLDRLEHAVARARRARTPLVMLFLDLDGFKSVNDSLGHGAGDELLRVVSERLVKALRPEDTVARLGGDEFLVLLEGVAHHQDAAMVAQKIQSALATPIPLHENDVYVSASIGITTYPRDGETPEALLRNADTAMYRAKEQGRNVYQFFAAEMHAEAYERMATINALRHALDTEQFRLYYQPVVQLTTGRVVGMETLLRWQHPDKGLILPTSFIHLMEESGLIVPVGNWVLHTAFRQYQAWRDAGAPAFRLKVNTSARQFWNADMAETVIHALETSGMDPALLTLELTENMMMKNTETFRANITALRELNIRFSIDDFGTGYSSLSYLRTLPIDSLKIDRSFVKDIPANKDDAAIVKAIISLAHHLHVNVIAEGVETAEQVTFLRTHGCDRAQGYFFSKALPSEKVLAFIESQGVEATALGSSTPSLRLT